MKVYVIAAVFLFSLNLKAQENLTSKNDTVKRKFGLRIEQSYFYRIKDKFSGTEVLVHYSININKRAKIGLATGLFYHFKVAKDTKLSMSRYDFMHIPIYLSFLKKSKQQRHYIQYNLGCVLKTFYDSEALLYTPDKKFWPSPDDLNGSIKYVYKRKHWALISLNHGIKIYNKLHVYYGFNVYFLPNREVAYINSQWSDRKVTVDYFTFYHMGLTYFLK